MTMLRAAAVFLACAMFSAGCATHQPAAPSRNRTVARAVDDPAVTHDFVAKLPAGSDVRVDLVTGERFSGTLMSVGAASMVIKPKTRIPEPARTIAFDTVARVEPASRGASLGKAIAIGAAIGGGAFFGFFLLLLANLN